MVTALVPIAPGSEELEAVTVIDLLRRAGVAVTVAGLGDGPIEASRGVRLLPDRTLAEAATEDFDLVVLPGGGPGAQALAADPNLQTLLRRHAEAGAWLGAICAAPSILAGAGLLAGRSATSFPGWLDEVADVDYREDPVVVDGRIVTSRGPGTAMDFALRLIELVCGREKAEEVEARLQRPTAQQLFAAGP
ncbi:DJ-1 family glyoxalase III [Sediminicurvatus halobius]|uniref:DJ-1 family protein n=1 Tax=Sediminicurvatus halobius TaxID=2182432 RepID=A0A2U2N369_9GAMM|nr:DJ-1 family glyoxalase III [Spiribacter halobius]PWG63424.1 DJ-1 family protein [Spiribacter halobius]UEX78095.1 DJ-1/PfpI family protein [Spiribacter halobius]